MERRVVLEGMVVLVAGLIMLGLGIYFVELYGISHYGSLLALFGALPTVIGLMILAGGGAVRFVGVFFLVVGTIGFAAALAAIILDIPTVHSFVWGLVRLGLWVGPVFMLIGLGSLLAFGWRKRVGPRLGLPWPVSGPGGESRPCM